MAHGRSILDQFQVRVIRSGVHCPGVSTVLIGHAAASLHALPVYSITLAHGVQDCGLIIGGVVQDLPLVTRLDPGGVFTEILVSRIEGSLVIRFI